MDGVSMTFNLKFELVKSMPLLENSIATESLLSEEMGGTLIYKC
jgi:hypothetical protein